MWGERVPPTLQPKAAAQREALCDSTTVMSTDLTLEEELESAPILS